MIPWHQATARRLASAVAGVLPAASMPRADLVVGACAVEARWILRSKRRRRGRRAARRGAGRCLGSIDRARRGSLCPPGPRPRRSSLAYRSMRRERRRGDPGATDRRRSVGNETAHAGVRRQCRRRKGRVSFARSCTERRRAPRDWRITMLRPSGSRLAAMSRPPGGRPASVSRPPRGSLAAVGCGRFSALCTNAPVVRAGAPAGARKKDDRIPVAQPPTILVTRRRAWTTPIPMLPQR